MKYRGTRTSLPILFLTILIVFQPILVDVLTVIIKPEPAYAQIDKPEEDITGDETVIDPDDGEVPSNWD